MRLPWFSRRQASLPPPEPTAFDALIDLDPALLPPGVAPQTACAAVARAVASLPGAVWINVEVHRQPAGLSARVFPAASGQTPAGEPWTTLAAQAEQAARMAMARLQPPPPSLILPEPAPSAAGFAEAMTPMQIDALAALTALAQTHQPNPQPRPPAADPASAQMQALAALTALAQTHQPQPQPRAPAPHPASTQTDALAALAALAQTTRQSKPAPRPPAADPASAQMEALASLPQSTRPPARAPAPAPEPSHAAADADIMARLLAFVLPADPRPTATAAVRHFGSFAAALAAPESELRQVPGLGTHTVAAVKLVHAAAVRLQRARASGQPVLDAPAKLSAYLAAALARERIEQFRILFLDAQGMLRADEVQARGTINHTPVYPREVVRRALELGASSLVLVHNHPSGDPEPSPDDLAMTRQVEAAANVMGIAVRDHVIVGNGRWLSFREQGLLG